MSQKHPILKIVFLFIGIALGLISACFDIFEYVNKDPKTLDQLILVLALFASALLTSISILKRNVVSDKQSSSKQQVKIFIHERKNYDRLFYMTTLFIFFVLLLLSIIAFNSINSLLTIDSNFFWILKFMMKTISFTITSSVVFFIAVPIMIMNYQTEVMNENVEHERKN